jgi:hypothetical protein
MTVALRSEKGRLASIFASVLDMWLCGAGAAHPAAQVPDVRSGRSASRTLWPARSPDLLSGLNVLFAVITRGITP